MSFSEAYPLDSPMYIAAVQLGMRGLRLLPVRYHGREAILDEWQVNASNDVVFIDEHFHTGKNNIGLCCGPQPNGWNLMGIDVDVDKGGRESWEALIAEIGPLPTPYPAHTTPTGGRHIYLNMPEGMARTGTNVLGQGIDLRGGQANNVGCGYILQPPSIAPHKVTGELITYGAQPGRGLLDIDPPMAPQALIERLSISAATLEHSIARHPSAGGQRVHVERGEEGPADYIRRTFDWHAELEADGMIFVGGKDGDEEWRRPGSGNHHSLNLHNQEVATVWSSNCPPWMQTLGWVQPNGALTINAWTYYCGKYHGGDQSAAGRHVASELRSQRPAVFHVEQPEVLPEPVITVPAGGQPQLAMEFWSARAQLEHIYTYAKAHRLSPEALLVHVLARYSTAVHPQWRLDMEGTLDFMGVVISPTGAFKTQAAKWVRHLYPGPFKREIRFDMPSPSGEGIAESFMVPDPDNKGDRKVGFQAAHFLVDEGKNLTTAGERNGSTVFPTLCSAWAGESIGGLNADKDKRRIIPPSSVRVSAVINIQKANSQAITSPYLISIGFAGRMIFVMATDPAVPDSKPPSPGPLHLPNWSDPPTYSGEISYPDIAWETIDARALAVHRDQIVIDPRESQRTHQQGKIAGLLALMDGRTSIVNEDWHLAGQVCDHSLATLRYLDAWHATTEGQAATQGARKQAEREAILDDERVIQRLIRWALGKVPPGGVTISALTRQQVSEARPALKRAIARAVDNGLLLDRDGTLFLP